jgi:recombination protein RecA
VPKAAKRATRAKTDDGAELTPELLAEELQGEFGESAASTGKIVEARDYISTQCPLIDYVIGRGGIPTGALTNIYGEEGSGKSTVLYHLLAETIRRGGYAVLYDAEGAYDYERGERIGIDFSKLIFLTPDHIEGAFDEIERILQRVSLRNPDALVLIGIDSIAAAVTKAQIEGSFEESHPAAQARAVSTALPKLLPSIRKTNTALVAVGQLRAKMSIGPSWGGPPQTTQIAEGSLKYYSFLRMYFRKAGEIGDKDEPSGIESIVDIRKNKTAPPYRSIRFPIDFLHGIDVVQSKLVLAQKLGLVNAAGGWYKYEDQESFRSTDFGAVLAKYPDIDEALALAPLLWREKLQ